METFVSSSDDLAYVTLLNSESKGISAGRIAPDAFLQRDLERAYAAAREGRAYNGPGLDGGQRQDRPHCDAGQHSGHVRRTFPGDDWRGGGFAVPDAPPAGSQPRGLTPYVVDSEGRLVAGVTTDYVTGQDMTNSEIVRNFLEQGGKAQLVAATREFTVTQGNTSTKMLGTYCPVGIWTGP